MNIPPFDEERTRKLYDEFMQEHPDADIPWEVALEGARLAHEELNKSNASWVDADQVIHDVARKVIGGIDFTPWTK